MLEVGYSKMDGDEIQQILFRRNLMEWMCRSGVFIKKV